VAAIPAETTSTARAESVRPGDPQRLACQSVGAGVGHQVLIEHAAEVEQAPLAHEHERLAALSLVHVVQHAELVVGAERRGPPARHGHSDDQGVRKLGNSVRPPC
jgi:hypothetical protein